MIELAQFHFLRPAWLLLVLPAAFLTWSIIRHRDHKTAWRGVIEEHLLDHLETRQQQRPSRPRPVTVLSLLLVTGILALAGPAWQREAAPFTEDQAALIIVLKVTPEMLAMDIQPSRLQRAVHKIRDLLELRPGSKNALIAYAGSAHLVMPLTTDAGVIETFAAALSPELMPLPGDEVATAVALANRRLSSGGSPGSIVLIADAIDTAQFEGLEEQKDAGGAAVHILAMAGGAEVIPLPDSPPAPALDVAAMGDAAQAAGGTLTLVSIDDADVRRLLSNIERGFANAPLQEGGRWRDAGYYLLPVVALLLALLFRRGGAVAVGGGRGLAT